MMMCIFVGMNAEELALIAFSFAKFNIADPSVVLSNLEELMLSSHARPIGVESNPDKVNLQKRRRTVCISPLYDAEI